MTASDILAPLTDRLGADAINLDPEDRAFFAQDLITIGITPLAIVSPDSAQATTELVKLARQHRLALYTRGGGMSYTNAFQPEQPNAIIVDFSRLAAIREVSLEDGHVTVEAGCTWAALDAALAPHGVRARFWGPMSGRIATIGGSLSQGSVTFGSGRAGNSANAVKSFEVVTGGGEILRTGSDNLPGTAPFNRSHGPDLTGLFGNDAGALGIKTAVTLELEPRPAIVSGLSFAFDDFDALTAMMRHVTLNRLASEIIAMDADVARQNAGPPDFISDMGAMWRIGGAAGNPLTALGRMARIAGGGRRFLEKAKYTAHFVVEARDRRELASLVAEVRSAAKEGSEIVNTMPLMLRASPFPELPVTHPDGRRMLPIHGIFAWGRCAAFHRVYRQWQAENAAEMSANGITVAEFFTAIAGIGLLYEPVFYWPDTHALYHRRRNPDYLRGVAKDHPDNPGARAKVEELIASLIALMRGHGATHFQIGRLYPHDSVRDPQSGALLRAIRTALDPDGIINPGALGQ